MDSTPLKTKIMYIGERKSAPIYISCPSDSYLALKRFYHKRQEHFLIFTLNGSHGVIALRIISIGLVNRTIVHPREIFIHAIKDNAVAIILAHNHPSGNTDPSPEDKEITNRLIKAADILGIRILDHIIFCKTGFYSFKEHGAISLDLAKN
jgi:DNA repair protein RadC